MESKCSPYESRAIASIHAWKSAEVGWLGKIVKHANWPFEKAAGLVTEIPGVDWVVEKAVGGLIEVLNDLAHWSIRTATICKRYEKAGFKCIKIPADVFSLDLEDADKVSGWLAAKYKALATAEGATTGYVGLPGIPADIVALVAMNQRAIAEYATYYGFDITSQHERLFALNILGFASSPNDAAKQIAMTQLVRIARDVAKKKVWRDLEGHTFVAMLRVIARALGIRLTKAKLAQAVPVTGAIVGGGFNAYYTSKVCEAAFHLYRERFLAEKYGEDLLALA